MRLLTDVCLLRMVFRRNTAAQIGNTRKKECASGAVGGMLRKQTVFLRPKLVGPRSNDKVHMGII